MIKKGLYNRFEQNAWSPIILYRSSTNLKLLFFIDITIYGTMVFFINIELYTNNSLKETKSSFRLVVHFMSRTRLV